MPIEKIVVVEDDQIVRKALEQQLRYRRYDVASVGNLADAREVLAKDTFDLVFTDVRLPDGDGTALLREIQSRPQKPLPSRFSIPWEPPSSCIGKPNSKIFSRRWNLR